MNTNTHEVLRLAMQVEGVTEKKLMFRVGYLPPKALARYCKTEAREVAISRHTTSSGCKNEPLFATRAEAQARAGELNKNPNFPGEYYHVVECFAVPPTPPTPMSRFAVEAYDSDSESWEAVDEIPTCESYVTAVEEAAHWCARLCNAPRTRVVKF